MFSTVHELPLLSGYDGWPPFLSSAQMVPQMAHVLPPKIDSRKQIGRLMPVVGGATSRCDNSNLSLNVNTTKRSAQSSLRSASMATHCSLRSARSLGAHDRWSQMFHWHHPILSKRAHQCAAPLTDEEHTRPPSCPFLPSIEELLCSPCCGRAPHNSRGHLGLLHSGQWICSM